MSLTTFSGPVASQNGFIDSSFTTAERDAIVGPQAGLLIYNTDTNTYEVYTGSGWQEAFAPPAPTTFGTPSWPSTYTVSNITAMFVEGSYSVTLNIPNPDTTGARTAADALPIGTVITVLHGTRVTPGITFTLTSQFSGSPTTQTATATLSGDAPGPGATIGQISVS